MPVFSSSTSSRIRLLPEKSLVPMISVRISNRRGRFSRSTFARSLKRGMSESASPARV